MDASAVFWLVALITLPVLGRGPVFHRWGTQALVSHAPFVHLVTLNTVEIVVLGEENARR